MRAGYPPEDELDDADLAAAKWCWSTTAPAGRGADTLPGAKRLFLPLRTARGPVGVRRHRQRRAPARCSRRTSGGCSTRWPTRRRCRSSASTWPRTCDRARLLAETERLRSALLTSISHDLRTPLASILGAASGLESYRRATRRSRPARPAAHHPGRGRAAQPVRRQPAGHDPAGKRRARAAAGGDRFRRVVAAPWRGPARAGRYRVRDGTRRPICRWCGSIRCCSSRCCSTCSTMRRNMRRRQHGADARLARAPAERRHGRAVAGDRRGPGHRRRKRSNGCSTNSTASPAATASAPAPGWGWRSAAASSRRWAAAIAAANRRDRSGAVFTVLTLPAGNVRTERRRESASSVLIVDDEPAIRRLLRTNLGAQGYRTLEAATAAEALAARRRPAGRGHPRPRPARHVTGWT